MNRKTRQRDRSKGNWFRGPWPWWLKMAWVGAIQWLIIAVLFGFVLNITPLEVSFISTGIGIVSIITLLPRILPGILRSVGKDQ